MSKIIEVKWSLQVEAEPDVWLPTRKQPFPWYDTDQSVAMLHEVQDENPTRSYRLVCRTIVTELTIYHPVAVKTYRVEHQCVARCAEHRGNDGWYSKKSGLSRSEAELFFRGISQDHPRSKYRICEDTA